MDATPQAPVHETTRYSLDSAQRAVDGPDAPSGPRRIAVLAVHGVGDQAPFESARAIPKLLVSPRSGAAYDLVVEQTVRVPVRPLRDGPPLPRASAPADATPRTGDTKAASDADGNRADDDLSLLLMDEKLRAYRGGEASATLQTVRLETSRRADDAVTPDTEVHVHELFCADRSRPGITFVRIAAELYQRFLHLANLAALVLDHQAARRGGAWRRCADQHGLAVGLITTVVPVWSVVMAGTLLALPFMNIPADKLRIGVAVLAAITAAWAAETSLGRRRPGSSMRHLLGRLAVGAVVGTATGLGVLHLVARVASAQYYIAAALWMFVEDRLTTHHRPGKNVRKLEIIP